MFDPCTYQTRFSFGLCLFLIYYQGFPLFESYKLGQSRFSHEATAHINYLAFYTIPLWEQSKTTVDYYYSQQSIQINATISFIISALLICELLFYLRWKYLERYIHSNISIFDVNPTLTNERRNHLLEMTAKYAPLHDEGMRGWISTWCGGCPFEDIYYDNATEFLEWAFCLKHYGSLESIHERDWSDAMRYVETVTQHTFEKGYNPDVSIIQNTNDDVPLCTTYRPFVFYLCLLIAQYLTDLVFIYILGFEYRFENGLKVWYYIQSDEYKEKESKPILLVHGLGVHYMPYIPFLYKLCNKCTQHDVICIEIPWTSMSIWHFIPQMIWKLWSNEASPSYIDSRLPSTKKDFVEIIQKMEDIILLRSPLMDGEYERTDDNALKLKWTLIGHSYGSFIVSGIYNYIKHGAVCAANGINVPRLMLVDPVTLCLTQPTTVSFVALTATDWSTYLLQEFASRELMLACTLRKYFHWFEYNMYPEDLVHDEVEHVVVTATNDTLIPNRTITKGINAVNGEDREKGYKKINHIVFEGIHHAMWMVSMSCVNRIVDAV